MDSCSVPSLCTSVVHSSLYRLRIYTIYFTVTWKIWNTDNIITAQHTWAYSTFLICVKYWTESCAKFWIYNPKIIRSCSQNFICKSRQIVFVFSPQFYVKFEGWNVSFTSCNNRSLKYLIPVRPRFAFLKSMQALNKY